MADIVIQPTRKFIRLQYWTVFLLLCVSVGIYANRFASGDTPWWPFVLPAILFFFPVRAHIRQHFTRATIAGDKLRYEAGMVSKVTRMIQISNIQDVRVDQTLMQRIMHIGSVSIETAGETSRLTLPNIDSPQLIAEEIMDAKQGLPARQQQAKKEKA